MNFSYCIIIEHAEHVKELTTTCLAQIGVNRTSHTGGGGSYYLDRNETGTQLSAHCSYSCFIDIAPPKVQ